MGQYPRRKVFRAVLKSSSASHKPVIVARKVLRTQTGAEVQEEARQYASDALKALRDIVKSPVASDIARISASQTLLDRGYGRPTQTNINASVNTDGKPPEITESELSRRITETITRVESLTKRKREKIKDEERPADVRLLN